MSNCIHTCNFASLLNILRRHGGRRRRSFLNVEEQILEDVLEHPDISARNLSLRYNLSYCFILYS